MGCTSSLRALVVLAALLAATSASRATASDGDASATAASDEETAKAAATVAESIEVTSRASELVGIADSAGEGVVGREDLARRPLLRAGELLETVPGVVISQHSGGGKANQYYLRGMNLDHGTDFRITVAGIPLNLPTHAHGQGYADLNFLIPELVDTLRFRKGPYAAEDGDFSAAGSAHLDYVRALPAPTLELAGGELGYGRALAAGSRGWRGGDLLGALEVAHSDGPWTRGDDLQRLNGVVRYSQGDYGRGFTLTGIGYRGRWYATDQIPSSAVGEGRLGRFDNLDSSSGGESRRWSLAAAAHRAGERTAARASAYLVYYDLDLFSNFTYFLDDPEHGDQFEQQDRRLEGGFALASERSLELCGRDASYTLGGDLRLNRIDVGLYHTERRARLATTRSDRVLQLVGGPYVEGRVRWSPRLRAFGGLRLDGWWADVDSSLAANSGRTGTALLSPKLGIVLGPWRQTELYLDLGYGFHSNDARGATLRVDPRTGEAARRVDPLVRARSLDLGVRTQRGRGLQSSLSLFALELDSELVFVGDAGGTEASRPSRRAGLELANFWQPVSWLRLDADVALTRARFTDDDPAGGRIPGAAERVVSAGLSLAGRSRLSGGLRLRHFGPRDLVEDGSVRSRSTTLLYGEAALELRPGMRLAVEVFNLLDAKASDIDYFYTSRLAPEAPARDDVHFHPVEPRSVRVAIKLGRG